MRSGMASNITNHRPHWQPGAARPGTRGQRRDNNLPFGVG
jgi:hypothetical protein